MAKIRRIGPGGQHYSVFETEDGRLFCGGFIPGTDDWSWKELPPLPETEEEREQRELEERARNLGITVPEDS